MELNKMEHLNRTAMVTSVLSLSGPRPFPPWLELWSPKEQHCCYGPSRAFDACYTGLEADTAT